MLYMVVEHFRGNAAAIYARARERGRMMPEGVSYVGSWVETNYDRCFQLMESEDPALLREWAEKWEDLVDFQFIPVVTGAVAAAAFALGEREGGEG